MRIVLAVFKRNVTIEALRLAVGDIRNGTTAKELLDLARQFGLTADCRVQVEPFELAAFVPPLILHWDFKHFVVLEHHEPDSGARIVDPLSGRSRVSAEMLEKRFTGVVLFFGTPNDPTSQTHSSQRSSRSHTRISPYRPSLESGVQGSNTGRRVAAHVPHSSRRRTSPRKK